MKRFHLTKKVLTQEKADTLIQSCFQSISVELENIWYWKQRIGKPLSSIDNFILMSDKFTPEDAVKYSEERIEYLEKKIYEDYGRFVEVKNTCG